jgi:hypothetical protein
MKTGSNNRYIGRKIGLVDELTIQKAALFDLVIAAGSINKNDKRVRVFVKGVYPDAHKQGYALRSRVVWWLNTGEVVTRGFDIHHKNHVRHDDRFENLEKLPHDKHARHHNSKKVVMVERQCQCCGNSFLIKRFRLKDLSRGRFCSQLCYHATAKNPQVRLAISRSLKRAYAEGRR